MAYRTRVFVDFWNFSLQWRDRTGGDRIDWTKIPVVLLKEGEKKLQVAGLSDELHLEETRVYASHGTDEAGKKLKNWLDSFLNKQPSFSVTTRPDRPKAGSSTAKPAAANTISARHAMSP